MTTWILTTVLNWASGSVLDKALGYFRAKANSEVEREKVKASIAVKHIDAEIEARRASRDIRLATAGFWEMRLITFVIALCFTWHLVLVTLDTVWWHSAGIPAFPPEFQNWEGAILLSFFGIYTLGKGVTAIAGAIASRR